MMTSSKVNPYLSFLNLVEKPARYIGGEHFSIQKEWTLERAKVVLCFPDIYEVGMGHLGLKILYQELNKRESILAERCFCPWPDMEKKILEHEKELVSLESYHPIREFDLVGFSLQYEMTYTNVLTMLNLGGIPIWAQDRGDKDPIVLAGGPSATHPEVMAPFIDLFVIGDGEELFVNLANKIGEMKREGNYSRGNFLQEVFNWKGVYIPSLYQVTLNSDQNFEIVGDPLIPRQEESKKSKEKGVTLNIERAHIDDLSKFPFPTKSPIPHLTTIFDKFSIEIARGCMEGCRFCQAGHIYRPVRERSPVEIVESIKEGIISCGHQEASLTALSTADFSTITPLVEELCDELGELGKIQLGISSLRAYGLDEDILDRLAQIRNTSLTFAPEVGSNKMRQVINKNISEEDMLLTAKRLFERGWKKMKLYFMLGLPFEEMEDLDAIIDLAKKVKEVGFSLGVRGIDITVSVSTFVPRPHTPFQWARMNSLEEIKVKQGHLFDLAKKYRLTFRKHNPTISLMEGILARGDRRMASYVYDAWMKGARFDSWDEHFNFKLWEELFKDHHIDPNILLRELPSEIEGNLPWSHIHVGVTEDFLRKEWQKSALAKTSSPCGIKYCHSCGLECDIRENREKVKRQTEEIMELREAKVKEESVKDIFDKVDISQRTPLLFREKRGQNVGYRYRIQFAKLGLLSFISHLDLQKVMGRIFYRAKVRTLYSEGHNERALISFGPALSLGVSSLSEYIDVRTNEEWENIDSVLQDLQNSSENGILFLSGSKIDVKESSIQEAVIQIRYFIPFIKKDENLCVSEGDLNLTKDNLEKILGEKFADSSLSPLIEKIAWKEDIKNLLVQTFLTKEIDSEGIVLSLEQKSGSGVKVNLVLNLLRESFVNFDILAPIKIETKLK